MIRIVLVRLKRLYLKHRLDRSRRSTRIRVSKSCLYSDQAARLCLNIGVIFLYANGSEFGSFVRIHKLDQESRPYTVVFDRHAKLHDDFFYQEVTLKMDVTY